MSDGKDKVPAVPAKAVLHFFTEVCALNRDASNGSVMVSCTDGSEYSFKPGEPLPKIRAAVVITVEIEL